MQMTEIGAVFKVLDEHKDVLKDYGLRIRDVENGHLTLKKDQESMSRDYHKMCIQLEITKTEVMANLASLTTSTNSILSALDVKKGEERGARDTKKNFFDSLIKIIQILPTLIIITGALISFYYFKK